MAASGWLGLDTAAGGMLAAMLGSCIATGRQGLAVAGHRAEAAGRAAQAATRGLKAQPAVGHRQALGLGQQTRMAVAQQEASAGHGVKAGAWAQTWAAELG